MSMPLNILQDQKVSKSALYSLYKALALAEEHIANKAPDLIIGPLRGSEPLIESMKIIADMNKRAFPNVLYIETGCIDSIVNDNTRFDPRALEEAQKVALVKKRLYPYVSGRKREINMSIIDEVVRGGSILKNYDYVNGAMKLYYPEKKFKLNAVGIAGPEAKTYYFEQMRAIGLLKAFFVENLFTVDRTRFLTPLIRTGDDVVQQGAYKRSVKSDLYDAIREIHKA